MRTYLPTLLAAIIITALSGACTSTVDPIEEPEIDGLFTLKVTNGSSSVPNAEVFALKADNTLKDLLTTNDAGLVTYDPADETLPSKLIIKANGFVIDTVTELTASDDTLSVNLSPSQDEQVILLVSNSYTELAIEIAVVVEGFTIDTLYSGDNTSITLPYGLPEGDSSEIVLLSPALDASNQQNKYQFRVDDLGNYRKFKLASYLKNTQIPDGTVLTNGQDKSFKVMPDGWVWYELNPAMGNENSQQFVVEGDDFDRLEFGSQDLQIYQNRFFYVYPFIDDKSSYSPTFEVEVGDEWKFDGTTSFFFSGSSRTVEFELTWKFEEISTIGDLTKYTITETAIGTATGTASGPVNETNTVVVTENAAGVWYYENNSDRSNFSIPLTDFNFYTIEQPSIDPQESILVKLSSGNEYSTLFGRIGRLAPNGTTSFESTLTNNTFMVNSTGIQKSEVRQGSGNNRSSNIAIRIQD